jgi:maleylacetoacetate isomerase
MSAPAEKLTLYTYFRSSAAWRARIALNLKGLKPEYVFVHLLKNGGQQHGAEYARVNPQEMVPTLVHEGRAIGQSLAIVEYLEECWPEPPLLPKDPFGRARVRQIADAVACDIHPLGNLRLRIYLGAILEASEEQQIEWQRHWIMVGFAALEKLLSGTKETGRFCHGDTPTLADIFLIPQIGNARRVKLDLAPYPTLLSIDAAAAAHPAFAAARPDAQPDAE